MDKFIEELNDIGFNKLISVIRELDIEASKIRNAGKWNNEIENRYQLLRCELTKQLNNNSSGCIFAVADETRK